MMLDFTDDASQHEKCFTTITQLPAFIDPTQVATKKSPFSAIINHPFAHTVEVILPEDAYSNAEASLEAKLEKVRFARVFMSLADLLEHDFFNTYIKTGNILLISEGRSGSDTVFSLNDGLLKIELGREIYEKTGLIGKPTRSGGRKHAKERYMLEINLRLPSMLHGKKGFERIVWAFKNVLHQSVACLFSDLDSASDQKDAKPIQKLSPQWIDCAPIHNSLGQVLVPSLSGLVTKDMPVGELQEACGSLAEWISMVQMRSSRVSVDDKVDSYLSRYSIPGPDEPSARGLVSLKWHGLISSQWTIRLLSTILSQIAKSDSWFTVSVAALDKHAVDGKDGYTIAAAPNICSEVQQGSNRGTEELGRYDSICWEFVGTTANGH